MIERSRETETERERERGRERVRERDNNETDRSISARCWEFQIRPEDGQPDPLCPY